MTKNSPNVRRIISVQKPPQSLTQSDDINELIELDMTNSFNSSNPPLNAITPINAQNISFHGMSTGGSNNDLMVVWGGETVNSTGSILLLYFDTKNQQMNPQNLSNPPSGRIGHSMVASVNDSMVYIFGGYDGTSDELLGQPSQTGSFHNELYKLDTRSSNINFIVIPSQSSTSPQRRAQHSATILSNGKIYIIGGLTFNDTIGQLGLVPMSDIDIFDTISNNLTLQKYQDIAVLDTFNDNLSWTNPTTHGDSPSARYSHTFTIVGNNAIVAYDVTNYTWKTQYNPQNLPPNPGNSNTNSSSKSNTNIPAIIGGIIGAIALAVIIAIILVCFIRRKKNSTFISTPYDKTPAAAPPIMGPAPVNDDLPPAIPPLESFQKDGSLGSDTRVLNSADQRSSFNSSHSNLSNNRLYDEQLDTGYQVGEYPPHSGIVSDKLLPLLTQFGDNNSQQSLSIQTYAPENYQTYPSENYQTQTYPPESYQAQTYPPESYQAQTYPPENYPTTKTPLTINTGRTQEYTPRNEFYNTQGQSYQPPSHSSSQENLSYVYRPDDRSSPTQETPESDSNEGFGFKSPLFRTESLSPLAGMATTIPTDSRPLSLRSAARMSQPLGVQPSRLRNENPESLDSGNETR
ncbi:9007_t:CDS:2 [Racocetra fulgida]|uniref:9007_t:CDS:1 n=1 Tax=Racocetra fulgida TaxID=60492 RepID=A0A9N8W6Y7_9GLOM|nr:9007_t:CDS:2 [Racocetra fulgida]